MLLLGAHMSIEGGVSQALVRGQKLGCTTIQLFTRNARQWRAPVLADDEVDKFFAECRGRRIAPVVAHGNYLVNLASSNRAIWRKSFSGFLEDLTRSERLGLPCLIIHPGSNARSHDDGIKRVAEALNLAHDKTRRTVVALETTAGQGHCLGGDFEDLAAILALVEDPTRIGACFDTCHVFAAGHDIRTPDGYRAVLRQFDHIIGLARLRAFHVNDSLGDLGSRLDRHQHIGRGRLGLTAFRCLMTDQRFALVPKILETPKGRSDYWDRRNLGLLRKLGTGVL
jgi:deoxyribonuclease-4